MQLFLLQLIRRNLKIKWFVKYFYKINKLLPGKSNLSIYPEDYRSIGSGGTDPNRIISKTKNNLVLEKEEEKIGLNYLKNVGIGSKKFICFIYRNRSYKKNYFPKLIFPITIIEIRTLKVTMKLQIILQARLLYN